MRDDFREGLRRTRPTVRLVERHIPRTRVMTLAVGNGVTHFTYRPPSRIPLARSDFYLLVTDIACDDLLGVMLAEKDPIGPEFYVPLGTAETISDITFYLAAALSIVVLLIDKTAHPQLYGAVQATFAAAVISYFVSGIVIRLYFGARAHSGRVADFVSHVFSVPLVSSPSSGYYNTTAEDSFVRMAASVLENSLFTKSILKKMLQFERARICVYGLAWLWAAIYRSTDLELLAVAAQVLFSEQLLSRWIRMEWLRSRVERLYDDLYALFQSNPNSTSKEFRARVIEGVIRYETGKAQAGVSLSTRIFNKINPGLSKQWETISTRLGIAQPTSPELQNR